MEEIIGKLVSSPLVLTREEREFFVSILIETEDGCEEFYYKKIYHSIYPLSQICGTIFSKIALSAVGDMVKIKINRIYPKGSKVCEILDFTNLTHVF